jgi:hypothetical protein
LFGVRFFFVVRYIKNARQTSSLPCARNKTHDKDFDAQQTRVFPLWGLLKSPSLPRAIKKHSAKNGFVESPTKNSQQKENTWQRVHFAESIISAHGK